MAAWSGCHGRQADGCIIADGAESFQAHVAPLHRPFVVLLEQDGTDQANDRGLVGEDPDHIGAALDLPVQPFQWIGAVDLGTMLLGECCLCKHIGLGVIHQRGQLRHPRAQLVGDTAPLLAGGVSIVLGEGGADPG